jgi:lipopolysaccharide export system protein LptA
MIRLILLALLLPLAAFAQTANQPVDISADSLEVDQDAASATFTGNVQVSQGRLRLAAAKITARYGKAGDDETVTNIDATGGVTVAYGPDTATGATARYDVTSGTIALEGNVVLTRETNTLTGERLVYDLTTGKIRLTAAKSDRVKARFSVGGKGLNLAQ